MARAAGWTPEKAAASCRWRLNRAGIVNVYQYGNEVLHFAGGRLLLRGVNGSGKSTAMNMLLPFLLTTHEGRIDAAGDQSGILKSWMLSGRDDAQPVGYLWIEFRRGEEFLVCGCGIKANRQADSVNTWWFITAKRPGIDLDLVAGGTALSSEALRAELDGDEVFSRARRRDYRRALEQRLFAGASIEQHIRLINKVRSPRVGDRVDLELRDYLVDALPQVSEQALAEAAQPLDDLDEHRRSVAELAKTLDAMSGLLDIYRSFSVSDLRRRVAEGRAKLRTLRRSARDEQERRRAAEAAAAEVVGYDQEIKVLGDAQRRLRREIESLEKSRAYEEGQHLEGLRHYVLDLGKQCEQAAADVDAGARRAEAEARELERAQSTGRADRDALNGELATATELAGRCRLDRRPPSPVMLIENEMAHTTAAALDSTVAAGVGALDSTVAAGVGALDSTAAAGVGALDSTVAASGADAGEHRDAVPSGLTQTGGRALSLTKPEPFDPSGADRELAATVSAVDRRRREVEQVETALEAERAAVSKLGQAEAARQHSAGVAEQAAERLTEATRRLTEARDEWDRGIRVWAGAALELLESAGLDAPHTAALAGDRPDAASTATTDPEALRAGLHAEAEALLEHWLAAASSVEARLEHELSAESEAQALVEDLQRRAEPEAPRPAWQQAADCCLADLIDFVPGLEDSHRAGLEAALESSGLLSARPVDGAFELETGELVAVASQGVARPVTEHLIVTVPPRLAGEVDEDLVRKLLESISWDLSSDAATVVTADGAFRIGSLRGHHRKASAEHIGATARRAALEKAREEARIRRDEAVSVVRRSREELSLHHEAQRAARLQRDSLPTTMSIVEARARADAAVAALDEAAVRRDDDAQAEAEAERALSRAADSLHRTAITLALPRDGHGLGAVKQELAEADSVLQRCRSQAQVLTRSVQDWRRACARWHEAMEMLDKERAALRRVRSKHAEQAAGLATLEDSIGAEYAEVVETRDRCRVEFEALETKEPRLRANRDRAFESKAKAEAEVTAASDRRQQAELACETTRISLVEALSTPGYVDALRTGSADAAQDGTISADTPTDSADTPTDSADTPTDGADTPDPSADDLDSTSDGPVVARAAGSKGLREMIPALERLVADGDQHRGPEPSAARAEAPAARAEAPDVTPDSVRQSLRQRRDAMGAGWDAEVLQPDPAMPVSVEVTGPSGRATLASSVRAVALQHQQVAGLLNRKQDDALRQLLQGMIAKEIAEKIDDAERLVEHMNRRLGAVATAHRVGVRLRWRRARGLDNATARLVELLSKRPDVRTPDQIGELRQTLADRLDDARAEQPELSYRQLIAETLDYRQWHEMAVMVRRGSDESRLSRSTPLSEGEKKLVSYLPLFAAVSASCDALAERQVAAGDEQPGIARFVLLDDAFAKVSEDNHAALFGLLVDLDLDFVATSERLWGTYATVPELAIVEVIRDATLSTILLEHYEWDGRTRSHEGGT